MYKKQNRGVQIFGTPLDGRLVGLLIAYAISAMKLPSWSKSAL